VSISKKFAVGTVTTSKWEEKTEKFTAVNEGIADKSNIYPLSNYFGRPPNASDPYDRRVTQKLDDIDFSEDEENDFEDVRNIKRQPRTVLTEENLKSYLGEHTLRLNLEHHYWLKDSFLGKLGRMAPSLQVLSLRRLKISNERFIELFGSLLPVPEPPSEEKDGEYSEPEPPENTHYLRTLEKLDISECAFIETSGMLAMIEACGETLKELQASNCQGAVNSETVTALAKVARSLEFLDLSYAKLLTDEGLAAF